MGALTDNRKRLFADHRLNSSYSIVDLSSEPETPPSKKLKPLPSPPTPTTAPLPAELRRPSPAGGIVRYPPVTPLPRPVHGPQRTLRVFGLGSSNSSRRSAIDDEISGDLEIYKKMVVDVQNRSAEKPPVELRLSPPSLATLPVVDLADVAQRPAEEASDMCILDQMAEDDDVKVVEESTLPVTEREWEEYKRSYEESLRKSDSVLRKLELEIKLAERKMFGFHLVDEALRKKPKEDLLEPFAPLSKEDEDDVCHALQGGRRYEVLVTHEASNIEITREILQCLSCGAWLNDEVINLYLELLKERERREPKKFLKCHFFNTFFYKKLISGRGGYDFKAVRRWTTQKKIGYGLIECDKIFVPIHKEIHWCLAVIDVKHKKFQFLDSLGGLDTMVLRILGRYFMDEVRDKSEKQIDTKSWKLEGVDDLPLQENGSDCGMFMLKYTDFYSRGFSLSFRQDHMSYFRKRTAKEILRLRVE